MALCLGIDVGGTFTDAVLTDGSKVWRAKSPTVAADLGQSVLDATTLLAQRAGFDVARAPAPDRPLRVWARPQ
jgi:N-methylhydantoinase A